MPTFLVLLGISLDSVRVSDSKCSSSRCWEKTGESRLFCVFCCLRQLFKRMQSERCFPTLPCEIELRISPLLCSGAVSLGQKRTAVEAHCRTFALREVLSGTSTSAALLCFCLAGVPWPARTCVTRSRWLLKITSTWTAGGTRRYLTRCTAAHHDGARLAELLGAGCSITKASCRETNLRGFFSIHALSQEAWCLLGKATISLVKMVTHWDCTAPRLQLFFFQVLIVADPSAEWPEHGVSHSAMFHCSIRGGVLLV